MIEVTRYSTMNTSSGLNARSPFLFSVIYWVLGVGCWVLMNCEGDGVLGVECWVMMNCGGDRVLSIRC